MLPQRGARVVHGVSTMLDGLAAIVLVGGRSSRMGRPKPWLDLAGRPLVALYRRTLAPRLDELVAAGERRLHVLADGPRVCRVPASALRALDPEGESFWSLNTPEEFTAASAAWQ